MTVLFYGKISSINYKTGTASITLPDRENQIIQAVPFLSASYEMPQPGTTVAVLFEEVNGQIGKGVILGPLFLGTNTPGESGPGIFYKQFSDGSSIKYTPDSGKMEINAQKIVVEELEYRVLTQR